MPLSHLRVIAIGSSAADICCARLFAGADASASRTERSGGGLRHAASLMRNGGSAQLALYRRGEADLVLDAQWTAR
jgi:hypothetical protein